MEHSETNPTRTVKLFWPLLFGLALVALALRCWQIEARPLHSDEGVNFHFLLGILKTGIYPYSHENYHGPLYFWLLWAANQIFGDSIFALRAVSIIFGTAAIFLPLFLRKQIGDLFVLIAALLIALSPSLNFHSRYSIHEMVFVFCCSGFALSLFGSASTANKGLFYCASAFLALMVSTKETFIIALAAVIGALVLSLPRLFFPKPLFRPLLSSLLTSLASIWPLICRAYLLFLAILTAIYSSGFRDIKSVRELVLGIPQWVVRGTTKDIGHFKPTGHYATQIVLPIEPYLPLAFILAGLAALTTLLYFGYGKLTSYLSPQLSAGFFLFCWTALTFFAYSIVPYKTPWLVINFTFPATLFVAFCLSEIFGGPSIETPQRWRHLLGSLLLVMITLTALCNTIRYNYDRESSPALAAIFGNTIPYGKNNPYSYVHTSDGFLKLVGDIEKYWELKPDARVLIGTNHYWPLPYYLREHSKQLGYIATNKPERYQKEYDVIIVDNKVEFSPPRWSKTYYRISDVQEAHIYFKLENSAPKQQ